MSAGIRVGQLARVARAVGNGPVNHEGHTGRVLDIADRNRAALIDFGDFERWVPLTNVIPVEAPGVTVDWGVIEERFVAMRTPSAMRDEPEGHDEHLDDIEAKLIQARQLVASGDYRTLVSGLHTVTGRVAIVPKGGV